VELCAETGEVIARAAAMLCAWRCVILRGLPGSGKSTLGSVLAHRHGYVLIEADQHFETSDGYRFDPSRVADAHAIATREACERLLAGAGVVVANTHVRRWELAAALGAATIAAAPTVIVECTGRWPNIHGVSAEVIATMARRWEVVPPIPGVAQRRWDGQRLTADAG